MSDSNTTIKQILNYILTGIICLSFTVPVNAQKQTVGLFLNDERAFRGYTLFAPLLWTTTYLIDNEGRLVHSWENSYLPGNSVYLLENGHLLRTAQDLDNQTLKGGGAGGKVQEIEWDGTVIWEYVYSNNQVRHHHDVEMLPNGNVLMIAWERKTKVEAITAGRHPNTIPDGELWPDHIIEVEPQGSSGGKIVWEWHVWDHLIQDFDSTKSNYGVVAEHPELININFFSLANADWTHTNAVDYNKKFDQILLSVREFSEIWIIDHSTTTEEAAGPTGGKSGKGGDLLYRWGNPSAYNMAGPADQKFFHQHDAQWIEFPLPGTGNILVFNNGQGRVEGNFSSVDVMTPPVDKNGHYLLIPGSAYGPKKQTWIYTAKNPTDFYSSYISGAQRLPNGNTLICSGASGTFFEVTPDKEMVWKYVNPVTADGPLTQGEPIPVGHNGFENNVFRAHQYAPDYPGLADRDLTPGDPIELEPSDVNYFPNQIPKSFELLQNFPNPFNAATTIQYSLSKQSWVTLKVFSLLGNEIQNLVECHQTAGIHISRWRANEFPSGIYIVKLQTLDDCNTRKIVLVK